MFTIISSNDTHQKFSQKSSQKSSNVYSNYTLLQKFSKIKRQLPIINMQFSRNSSNVSSDFSLLQKFSPKSSDIFVSLGYFAKRSIGGNLFIFVILGCFSKKSIGGTQLEVFISKRKQHLQ